MRPWHVYLAHCLRLWFFWWEVVVVGGRITKTNMMAIDYNLTYNLTIGKNATSLGMKEPATSY